MHALPPLTSSQGVILLVRTIISTVCSSFLHSASLMTSSAAASLLLSSHQGSSSQACRPSHLLNASIVMRWPLFWTL